MREKPMSNPADLRELISVTLDFRYVLTADGIYELVTEPQSRLSHSPEPTETAAREVKA
jgi:hypothetical protein